MAVKRGGLGKGLDALISEKPVEKKKANTKAEEKSSDSTREISINEIEPNKNQPRERFDEDGLVDLADSIKQHGIFQPIIVTKGDNGFYQIVAGERRWRAAKMAGLKTIPALVRDYSELEILEISLLENLQRENLNPIEEAKTYKRFMDEFHMKQDEVAEKVSKSRATVANSLRLLNLDGRVQEMLIEEKISMGHARALLGIADNNNQYSLATEVFDNRLSVREVEKLVKNYNEKKPEKQKESAVRDFIYGELENNLKEILGSKVNICDKNGKGKIEIEYYSKDDLDRIYDMLYSINKQ
ncbi:MAG: ParB/RepB/Spo0J family partition protein [Lachnospiraceae bacterium]|nr:ParB/RepB/Spo0J family partition protein [Lachnospiraceae bacterium]